MIRTKLGNIVLLAISAITVVFVAPLTAQEPNFGRAIVMTPTDLVIGQPVNWYGPGTVYAYSASQEGWEEPQLLTAPDSSRMDDFGHAIAVDGNTMAIGTPPKARSGWCCLRLYPARGLTSLGRSPRQSCRP